MGTNKQIKISVQDLKEGKYANLRPVELLRTCNRCYILQVRKNNFAICVMSKDGSLCPINAYVDNEKGITYRLPHHKYNAISDPIWTFYINDYFQLAVQQLCDVVRAVNANCTIYAGTAGCGITTHSYINV